MTKLLPNQRVFVVDDDEAVRDSLEELMASVGIDVECFNSAKEFWALYDPTMEGCVILDIRMPGMSGLDLQEKLIECDSMLSIIFITGHGDVPMAVDAMKRGAIEFIQKPFRDQDLIDCIQVALEKTKQRQLLRNKKMIVSDRLDKLTVREREVLDSILKGHANKIIAGELGISQRTVENHRARIMEKMEVKSTTELVKIMLQSSIDE